jgi:homoaconitase
VFNQSCTGLATIANMGAEVGATTSTFPYTPSMQSYLRATGRSPVAEAANWAASKGYLKADEHAEYDEIIEIVSIVVLTGIVGPQFPSCRTWKISSHV